MKKTKVTCKRCWNTSIGLAKFCGNCGVSFHDKTNYSIAEVFKYIAVLDEKTCDVCKSLNGMRTDEFEILPKPPNPQCKNETCRCSKIDVD